MNVTAVWQRGQTYGVKVREDIDLKRLLPLADRRFTQRISRPEDAGIETEAGQFAKFLNCQIHTSLRD
jgi:hypothetical protein